MNTCSNIGRPRECQAESSKSDREGKISYDIPYTSKCKKRIQKEMIHMNLLTKQNRKLTYKIEQKTYLQNRIENLLTKQNLKRDDTHELTYKIETDSQTQGTELMVARGKGRGKGQLGSLRWTHGHTAAFKMCDFFLWNILFFKIWQCHICVSFGYQQGS